MKLGYYNFLVPFKILKCKTMQTNHGTNEKFFKSRLKDIALSGYNNFSPPNFLLTQNDYKILKGLKDQTGQG